MNWKVHFRGILECAFQKTFTLFYTISFSFIRGWIRESQAASTYISHGLDLKRGIQLTILHATWNLLLRSQKHPENMDIIFECLQDRTRPWRRSNVKDNRENKILEENFVPKPSERQCWKGERMLKRRAEGEGGLGRGACHSNGPKSLVPPEQTSAENSRPLQRCQERKISTIFPLKEEFSTHGSASPSWQVQPNACKTRRVKIDKNSRLSRLRQISERVNTQNNKLIRT